MIFAGIPFATFLTLFGAGAGAIILIYILRLRRRGIRISSDFIWRRVLTRQYSFLSELISLLVQILILFLICLALMDPRTELPEIERRFVILAFDTSLSMAAKEPGGTRLDRAKREAGKFLDHLGPDDEAMILAVGRRLNALTGFTSDRVILDRALKSLNVSGVDGDTDIALAYASDAFEFRDPPEGSAKRVVVFTDRPRPENAKLDETVLVDWAVIGSSASNLAITAFDVRQTFNQAPGNEVFVRVHNYSEGEAAATLNVYTPEKLVGREKIKLEPGGTFSKVYFLPIDVTGRLMAGLNDILMQRGLDALPYDDVAFAVLPSLKPINVLLVSSGNRYLESALRMNPLVRLRVVPPSGYSNGLAASNRVVILDCVSPGDVPAHAVYIYPASGGPFALAPEIEKPVLTTWEGGHPLLRYVTLNDLEIARARPLKIKQGDDSLIETFDGSLLLVRQEGRYKRVALGFDLTKSDLPLRVAFPVFVHDLIWWLGGFEASELPSRTPLGERAVIAAEDNRTELELTGPGELQVMAAGSDGRVGFVPQVPGFYEYDLGDSVKRWSAAALLNPNESDLAEIAEAGSIDVLEKAREMPAQRVFWHWLILAAFVLALIDWLLFQSGKLA